MEQEDATEHRNSVTEEVLQIIEDFADYIDVFLFEILTFLAVFNALMNLAHDILDICGVQGIKMAFPGAVSFTLSLALFLFGTKKRGKKRRSKKLSSSSESAEESSGGIDLETLCEVTQVFGDLRKAVDQVQDPSLDFEESSSSQAVVIEIGSEPDDDTSDDQNPENEHNDSYFRSAVTCFVNMIRRCQRKKKDNEIPKDALTSELDHGLGNTETTALTKDLVPVEGNNQKDLSVGKVGKRLKESAYGVENAIQKSTAMVPLEAAAMPGHDLYEEAEFMSGYVKTKRIEGEKALQTKATGVLKHGKEKLVDGSKKISLEMQSGSEYLTSTIDAGGKKCVRFGDFSGEEEEEEEEELDNVKNDAVDESSKGKKSLKQRVMKGASSKAKKLNAKRKKGIKKARRRRPKSLLQIYRRLGRLILRVVCRRPPESNQEEEKVTDEAMTPRQIPRKVIFFFVRIYLNYKMKRNNRLRARKALSRVRIVKVPGNEYTESKYVVCNPEYSWFESRTEVDPTALPVLKNEEDEVNPELDGALGDGDDETVSPACGTAEKPLSKNVNNLKRKMGISGFVDFNEIRDNQYNILQNDEKTKCNVKQTEDRSNVFLSDDNDEEESHVEGENMNEKTKKTSTNSTSDNNNILLTINDLESSIVLHTFPKPTHEENKNGCEERPQSQSCSTNTTLWKQVLHPFSKPTCEETKDSCEERPLLEEEQSYSKTTLQKQVLHPFSKPTGEKTNSCEERPILEEAPSCSANTTLQKQVLHPFPKPTCEETKQSCEERPLLEVEQRFPEKTTLQKQVLHRFTKPFNPTCEQSKISWEERPLLEQILNTFPHPTCQESNNSCKEHSYSQKEQPHLGEDHSSFANTTLQEQIHYTSPHPTCEESKNSCEEHNYSQKERPHLEEEQSSSANTTVQKQIHYTSPHPTCEGSKTSCEERNHSQKERSHLEKEQISSINTTLQECTNDLSEQSRRHSSVDLSDSDASFTSMSNDPRTSNSSLDDAYYDCSF